MLCGNFLQFSASYLKTIVNCVELSESGLENERFAVIIFHSESCCMLKLLPSLITRGGLPVIHHQNSNSFLLFFLFTQTFTLKLKDKTALLRFITVTSCKIFLKTFLLKLLLNLSLHPASDSYL